MIYQIIRREILDNLLSLRFMLSILLIISLFAASGFVFVDKYTQRIQDYWEQTNKNLSALSRESDQLYKLAFCKQEIWKMPRPLSFCAEGFEKSLPNYFKFDVFTMEYPEAKSQSNFVLDRFSDIDWVFIISLIISFIALLLTYDAICGEKEAGTLRLMLAGAVARHKILLAKYISAMFTIGIPLLLGILVSLIIIVSSNTVVIGAGEWSRIIAIVLLSFLYLSIFVLLGMFVSSRTAHSASSMVILLLVWVSIVILIPSFGRIISNTFQKLPTKIELNRKKTEAREEIAKNADSGKYGEKARSYSDDPKSPWSNPPARAKYTNAKTDRLDQIFEEQHNKMMSQAIIGRHFTCVSPTVIYQRASEGIASTGVSRCMDLYQQIKRYQANLKEYIRSKDEEDIDSLHLLFAEEFAVRKWGTISKKSIDFETVPKFQERNLGLGESLQLAIWDIGLLVIFNLIFFAAAFISFLRYDVR